MLWLIKLVEGMGRSGGKTTSKGKGGQIVEPPQEEVPEEEIPIRRRKNIAKLKELEAARDSLDIKMGGL